MAENVAHWKDRFDLTVYTMDVRGVDANGIRVRRIWRPPGPHLARFLWWLLANRVVRAWDSLRLGSPDVVHSPGVNGLDARAIGVHIDFGRYGERVIEAARRNRLGANGLRRLHRSAWVHLLRVLENRVYAGPATLWACSTGDARALEARHGRPAGTVPTIPHGVDAAYFSPDGRDRVRPGARRSLVPAGGTVLLLVGNDGATKGLDTAIRAIARLPSDYYLAVVGRDDLRPYLRLASALDVRERLLLWDRHHDMLSCYAAADILVAPSRFDAFHLPALEAMACGLPIVVSPCAGVSELIEDGREAIVMADPENDADLAARVRRIAENPGLGNRLAAAGRRVAEANRWDVASSRAADLIQREVETPRVLVLALDAFGTGGIEQATRTLAGVLAERWGPERVGVLSLLAPRQSEENVAGRLLGPDKEGRVARERLRRTSRTAFVLTALATARRWRGRKLILVATHAHLAPVAWMCRRLTGAPYAVWAHGQELWGRVDTTVRWAVGAADAVVAPSRFTASAVQASVPSSVGNTRLIPHCLASAPSICGVQREPGLVLSVARLDRADRYKGVDMLLHAWPAVWRRVPGARLEIVGDGGDRHRLERLARYLGCMNGVRFRGHLGRDDRDRAYARASVFALPGRLESGSRPGGEGFGIVFLEAAAAGLPCVGGNAGGVVEAVEHGVTGLLADPEDPAAIADAVVTLLQDDTLARSMGEAGCARVRRNFSRSRFGNQIVDLLEDLLPGSAWS